VLVDAIPPLQEMRGVHAIGLIASWATAVMTQNQSGKVCATALSCLCSRCNTEHGSGLGRWRWVVERSFAWLNQFRRLRVRYEKRADIHEASCPWRAL
jgi:transposase